MGIYIDLRGNTYQIVFRYSEDTRRRKGRNEIRRNTLAVARPAKDKMDSLPTYQALSVCHPADLRDNLYDRGVGRRYALGRLLKNMGAAPEERKAAWKEYFERTRDGIDLGFREAVPIQPAGFVR